MSSPTSTGPAGSHFEGKVGAYYLLAMLVGAPPRGLPGTTIDRVELQRAPERMYLDDVVVRAHDERGRAAVLEIQVKRTISFAPGDNVFRSVVEQIAKTSAEPDFWNTNYQLAIATARTSRKIDGAYQDVLTWARQLGDAKTFMDRIARPGSANPDMRTFVQTFTSHLRDAGAQPDEEFVWRLLGRLQILIYDFTAQGSSAEDLARERSARALDPGQIGRAGDLWRNLSDLALEIAEVGGDRDRNALLADLDRWSFRLAALPNFAKSRAALADASRHALEHIGDQVSGVRLTRQEHVAAAHVALEINRYVEIRGDSGVGKSAILRHLAEQVSTESQILFLTPDRTPPRGWLELKTRLEFSGSCCDLLFDLAGNGGAVIFIDSLDFFPLDTRLTVSDIVRDAATVPGLSVVVTCRRDYGRTEPSWLPNDAVALLLPAEPIFVDELSEKEVDELRQGAPRLGWLLADHHPARSVTRNLYRLSRLASLSPNDPVPLSEAEMATRWWSVADGAKDELYRDRSRLLLSLANQVLERSERLDASGSPAAAVDALVRSETLRDLGNDRVAFQHDVLREWAVANVLFSDAEAVNRLPLDRPAPPDLARSVELAARMTIERATDSSAWLAPLERLSADGVHGSWRRAVLLALPRSEAAIEVLPRTAQDLLGNGANLLRELIRTVMAVDTEPASKHFAVLLPESATIPEGINVPSGPSWSRLIRWLLAISDHLPATVIPPVAKLYGDWALGMMGVDPLTPLLVVQIYQWLMAIESPRPDQKAAFEGLSQDQIFSLATDLRTTFLLFCNRTPALASEYLKSFEQRTHREESMLAILKFRGALAQAAPADLVDFTLAALTPKPRRRRWQEPTDLPEKPFDYADLKFIPASPAQGPFLELLVHAPTEGLRLIRGVVEQAVAFYSRGRDYGDDAVQIPFDNADRTFPWTMSYVWSRPDGNAPYLVTSALMALEVWAHRRGETGEPIEAVIAEVLGDQPASAAFLLIAVDLLISHWPKSKEAVIPYLACPELLSMDRNRFGFDNHEELPDLFNLKELQKEPPGLASIEELNKLPSRTRTLDDLLDHYVSPADTQARDRLVMLLGKAAARLEVPTEDSTLFDPRLMVRYALNRLDRKNWRDAPVQFSDGSVGEAPVYVSPPDEARHFRRLEQESRDRRTDAQMSQIVGKLLDLPGRATMEFIVPVVDWAQRRTQELDHSDDDANWILEQAIYATALIAARDGTPELRLQHKSWLRKVFTRALQTRDDDVHRVRAGLKFNPVAIAFLGMIHLLREEWSSEDVRALLAVAGRDNPAAARGMASGASDLAGVDERLPRAMLRTAFVSQTQPERDWAAGEQEHVAQLEVHRQRVLAHIEGELAWLENRGPEPTWPEFVPRLPYLSYQSRRRSAKPEPVALAEDFPAARMRTDSQGAGIWLGSIEDLLDVPVLPWLRTIITTYKEWTKVANGAGFDADERIEGEPNEWNEAYFRVLPVCLSGLSVEQIDEVISDHLFSLPEESFFDLVTLFQRNVDQVYFNGKALEEAAAVRIRSLLAQRMIATSDWKYLRDVRKDAAEMHLAAAIAVLFFVDHGGYFAPAKSYLLEKGIERMSPFLPTLQLLAADKPSPFVANMALTVLEVSPRAEHLPLLVACGQVWMPAYKGNSMFWIDYGFGKRWCSLVSTILKLAPHESIADAARKTEIDHLLAYLVTEGVAEASQLEEDLRGLG